MSQQQQQATVKTPEDQLREAEVRAAKAAISPNGYLIKAPVSWLKDKDGRDLAGQVPLHRLNIHRHIVPDGTAKGGIRKVDGGFIELLYGRGYTDNPDWANWIADEYGPKEWMTDEEKEACYKVIRVGEDGQVDYIVKLAQLDALVTAAAGG